MKKNKNIIKFKNIKISAGQTIGKDLEIFYKGKIVNPLFGVTFRVTYDERVKDSEGLAELKKDYELFR